MSSEQTLTKQELKKIVEAVVFASPAPISIEKIQSLVFAELNIKKMEIEDVLQSIKKDYSHKAVELVESASGFSFRTKEKYGEWISKLWQEKPPKYGRALLETLALIAYQQPITRGEIEDVRGVAVSSNIIKTLSERQWIKVVGHKEVPGRPALYGTDKPFLDYFGLKSLSDLPQLIEPESLEAVAKRLETEFMGHNLEQQPDSQQTH
ncbi:SMC-Scp complex subunit ScpB [Psychrosphaera ytuae]|uniref:SMC-Scp complex subunit ScpB n=1 Tax=Psychrosphaera ytuae TaxID=2820710 RepID=A0A975DBP5_9GAMM|nr:SMC-Scp complex subunit ScpB [Psychrosphaera ytuae]QTH64205.1 SMC-Scp complex subunit ScpB [Psychrosphaera ytuae]